MGRLYRFQPVFAFDFNAIERSIVKIYTYFDILRSSSVYTELKLFSLLGISKEE